MEREIQTIRGDSSKHYLMQLSKFINGKLSKDAILRILIDEVLKSNRLDLDIYSNMEETSAKLFSLLHRKNDSDTIEIFKILLQSRERTSQLCSSYHSQFSEDLLVGLQKRYSAISAFAIQLLVRPIPEAIAILLIESVTVKNPNVELLVEMFAKFDKNVWTDVKQVFTSFNQFDSIESMLKEVLKGKLKDAILSWVNSPSFDKDTEIAISDFVISQQGNQNSWNWIRRDDTALELRNLMENNVKVLCEYLKVPFTALPIRTETDEAVNDYANENTNYEYNYEASLPSPAKNNVAFSKLQSGNRSNSEEIKAIQDVAQISSYLQCLFQSYDETYCGSLSNTLFWDIVTSPDKLNLEEFGFTVEEIGCMEQLCDWVDSDIDNDVTTITYNDVISELAMSMAEACNTNNLNVSDIVSKRMIAFPSASNDDGGNPDAGTVEGFSAPDLEKYMRDTFESYDLQHNGYLSVDEFVQMIHAMNLGTTDHDVQELLTSWDVNQDEKISWKEALPSFLKLMYSMASDQRDHWVCTESACYEILYIKCITLCYIYIYIDWIGR